MKVILSLIVFILAGTVQANQNHLLPVPAYDSYGYTQAVFESLIGDTQAEFWMVVRPSFSLEYAVILHQYEDVWRLEKVTAKDKIWAWKDIGEGRSVLDIKSTKDVTREYIAVNKHDLGKIILAWKSVLKTTRYSESELSGRDGTTYQFYSHHQLFGQTWSPSEGLPLMLVNLGNALKELVTLNESERQVAWVNANDIASEIISEQP